MNMISKLKEGLKNACENGLRFPYAHDPISKKPSVTLLTYYTSFYMTVGSLIYLHSKSDPITAAAMTMLFWVLSYIFYRIRKLDKAKISLKDKSIELDATDEIEEEEKKD